jgi:hypothetical protein
MPTTINASNTSGGAIITPDGSGVLELQSGGVTGLTVSGANVTVAGTLAATGGINISGGITGTLPVANGGTGAVTLTGVVKGNGASAFTASTVSLTTEVSGTLPVANGGTGITSFGAGVATFLGTPSSANLAAAVTDETGTGVLVFATSPTLVTPTLGAASATSIDNALGAVGTPSYTFTGDLNTGMWSPAANTLAFSTDGAERFRINSTGGITSSDLVDAVGYKGLPQNSQSSAYTLVLADAGKHIFHPVGDNNARTFTIPANSSVAFPVGTAITFINMSVANVTIAITTDTLTLSPAGTSGSRTLATNGSATCVKITSTQWLISGSGLT